MHPNPTHHAHGHRRRRRRPLLLQVVLAALVFASATATNTDKSANEGGYEKPDTSSKHCVKVTTQIAEKSIGVGNRAACMQCDPTLDECPQGCQPLIDKMYVKCDGVTLPDGLYFDPAQTLEGEWSVEVKEELRRVIGRCGCSGAAAARLSWTALAVAAAAVVVWR